MQEAIYGVGRECTSVLQMPRAYRRQEFPALATRRGLVHVCNVNAFILKVMVFDKRP